MIKHIFTNDLNVELLVPDNHPLCATFTSRSNREVLLRKIHSYLFLNNFIQGNILDCGAWIGDNAIPWSKLTNNIVYAIDPSEENCNFIHLMKEINNLNNISIHQIALSNNNIKLSTNNNTRHAKFEYGTGSKNIVDSFSIDYLHDVGIINNLSCLHLDVEGMEHDVISGGITTIVRYQPIISFEQHINTDNYHLLCGILSNYNYDNYMINETLKGCKKDCRNFLSLPKKSNFHNHIKNLELYCNKPETLLKI